MKTNKEFPGAAAKFLKAKPGDFYYESLSQLQPWGGFPRVLKFLALRIGDLNSPRFGPPQKDVSVVDFEIMDNGAVITVDADDRYGHFPPLTRANFEKIMVRQSDLQGELNKYNALIEQIDEFTDMFEE